MTIIETRTEPAAPARWTVDRERTTVEFAVRTLWGLATVRGRFERFDGRYEIGPDGPTIELTIDADSLDTGNATRDRHLRSADFFHVEEHPQVRFVSTRVADAGAGSLRVEGELAAGGGVAPLAMTASTREHPDALELEATALIDPRRLGMSRGVLGMIRPPATLHVRATGVPSTR
jgi:polyisoprenoid-binding protein YceI